MTAIDSHIEEVRITCEICMKEVPLHEATIPEVVDYIIHFCGLECFEEWKSQQSEVETLERKSAS